MSRIIISLILVFLVLTYFFLPSFIVKSKYPLKYQEIVIEEGNRNKLSPALVASVIYNESRFNPKAVSDQEAIGLMQIQIPTAKEVYRRPVDQAGLKDPKTNIKIGTGYLKGLIKRYSEKELALVAYNLGPTALDFKLKKGTAGEDVNRKDLGIAYDFASAVQRDERIYLAIYGDRLGVENNQPLSPYQLWKIIFTRRL